MRRKHGSAVDPRADRGWRPALRKRRASTISGSPIISRSRRRNSQGSDGRYLEPLATLAFLAGITERVALAVGVLIVPYRPALLTAKWIASIQELSGGRLMLGVGVGWMEKEFRALGVEPRRRGAITDATLAFLHACFAGDEVEANGQTFLFRPRPPRPPIIVGGAPPHAIRRAVRFGDGWMPTGAHAEVLEAGIASLRDGHGGGRQAGARGRAAAAAAGRGRRRRSRPGSASSPRSGVTRVVHPWRYRDAEEVARVAARLVSCPRCRRAVGMDGPRWAPCLEEVELRIQNWAAIKAAAGRRNGALRVMAREPAPMSGY